jgi:DNA-binding MarR family transcriptional regulator
MGTSVRNRAVAAAKRQAGQAAPQAVSKPREREDRRYFVEAFIPYLLNHVVDRYNKLFKQALKSVGLTIPQWRVVAVLNSFDGLSFTEIQELTVIDQPTLSRTVDQMAKRDIVVRASRPDDARFAVVSLTAKGREMYNAVWPVAWNAYALGVRGLSGEEQEQFAQILKRILTNLKEFPLVR